MQRALRKADLSPPSQRRQRMQSQSTNRVVAITGYSPNYNSEPQTTSGPVCKDCVEVLPTERRRDGGRRIRGKGRGEEEGSLVVFLLVLFSDLYSSCLTSATCQSCRALWVCHYKESRVRLDGSIPTITLLIHVLPMILQVHLFSILFFSSSLFAFFSSYLSLSNTYRS